MIRFITLLLFCGFTLQAQQTAGLFLNEAAATPGYTLLAPLQYPNTYLLDNCGRVVHEWAGTGWTGSVVYLLDDGSILRAERSEDKHFFTGGKGGKLLRINWDSSIAWAWEMTGPQGHPHHDIDYLPNGNILILAWEIKTPQEALDAGRNPDLLPAEIWSEMILEIQPIGTDSAQIVWEWHLWDHLVQDFNPTLPNYGLVAEQPERIDLNYIGLTGVGGADWVHLNSIDYNPELDQILVASRAFSEIWIIDHSTTTQEAAGHSGGQSGKGGDLLYRWGNPQTYQQGNEEDQTLFTAHDAHWIEAGLPDEGKIMLYNNGVGRPEGVYSSVEILQPPTDAPGSYVFTPNTAYGPEASEWIYTAGDPESFFSKILSGAQRLANGNTLICEGMYGRIFEITPMEEVVWEYVNPVNQWGPVSQGDPATQNHVFRAYRFEPDHPALADRALLPGAPLELNPWPIDCALSTAAQSLAEEAPPQAYPLPCQEQLFIENTSCDPRCIKIWDASGTLVQEQVYSGCLLQLEMGKLAPGLYALQMDNRQVIKVLKGL